MKFTLPALVLFAMQSPLGVRAQYEKTDFDLAVWCCYDGNEVCSDACAWINNCQNQLAFNVSTSPMWTGHTIRDASNNDCITFGLSDNNLQAAQNGMNPIPGGSSTITIAEVPAMCRQASSFAHFLDGPSHIDPRPTESTSGSPMSFSCCAAEGSVCGDPHFKVSFFFRPGVASYKIC